MKTDSPLFLSVNYSHTLIGQKQNEWYKAMSMGINHQYKLTKTLIKSCPDINDNRKLTNHSARRHLVQKLQDKGVQNPQIMQISGHKNVASINSYSRLNQNQQQNISKVLADTEGKILYDNGKSDCQVDVGPSMGQLCR